MTLSSDPPDVMSVDGWGWSSLDVSRLQCSVWPRVVLPCLVCAGHTRALGSPFPTELLLTALTWRGRMLPGALDAVRTALSVSQSPHVALGKEMLPLQRLFTREHPSPTTPNTEDVLEWVCAISPAFSLHRCMGTEPHGTSHTTSPSTSCAHGQVRWG